MAFNKRFNDDAPPNDGFGKEFARGGRLVDYADVRVLHEATELAYDAQGEDDIAMVPGGLATRSSVDRDGRRQASVHSSHSGRTLRELANDAYRQLAMDGIQLSREQIELAVQTAIEWHRASPQKLGVDEQPTEWGRHEP